MRLFCWSGSKWWAFTFYPINLSTATLPEVIEYLKEKTDHATTSDRVK
jgi:hypothetical protein